MSQHAAMRSGFEFDASPSEGEGGPRLQSQTSWTPEGEVAPQASSIPDENMIIDQIATVYDPEIPVNVYELGLIYAIDIYPDGRIRVEMTLTAPNCPSAQELPLQVKEAVEKVEHVRQVEVDIVWDPPWDPSRMSEEARFALNMF